MNKNKIRLMIAGFVLAATWAGSAQADPPDVVCNGNREAIPQGVAKNQFGLSDADFEDEDQDGDQWICCKVVGNDLTQCQDDRFD